MNVEIVCVKREDGKYYAHASAVGRPIGGCIGVSYVQTEALVELSKKLAEYVEKTENLYR